MSQFSDSQASSSLSDVYTELQNRILTLQYKPGRGLSTATLAKELNISRSPIREALMKLSSENFVNMFPKIGSRVSLIDLDQTNDERFLRKSIELYAIQNFVVNRTNENLKEMYYYIEKQIKCAKDNNFIDLLRYDNLFHQVIFKGIGKIDVWRHVQDVSPNDTRIRLLTFVVVNHSFDINIENHEDIVHAAEKRDVNLASMIMEMHLTRNDADISKITFQLPEIFKSKNAPNNCTNIRTFSDGVDNYLGSLIEQEKKGGFSS
jgi:DNA-binding GntR family transcriptional regulator